jgi:anaerobic magnesium-protoporphyrin IX monomethyl ester cyclase
LEAKLRILLIAYDNDSHISYFPLGLAYIAAVCRDSGHDVIIYNQDVYHWPEEHLTSYLDHEHFDVVGLSFIGGYYQYRKALKISEAINCSKNRPFYIIGGHGPSPEPEYFLRKTGANVVVIGEGEKTIVDLLDLLLKSNDFSLVPGIAFIDSSNNFVQTRKRELEQNIDDIPYPAWDLFPIEHYTLFNVPNSSGIDRHMVMLSGRGCKFKCNFCYRMDKGLRIRSSNSIINEIRILKKRFGISYIGFWDELLMNSVSRIMELCQNFIDAGLNIKWSCNGRLNYAEPVVLDQMKKAGCVFINYGIESMDDKTLKIMDKALTVKQIKEGVVNTLASGISPGLNIIFGNIGETAEILKKDVEFLLEFDDHAQLRTIRPVTPYPGSPLYYYAIKKGLLEGPQDFYENKHTNSDLLSVNFTNLSNEEFHRLLYEANQVLIEKYFHEKKKSFIEKARKLYLENDQSFRGFRFS